MEITRRQVFGILAVALGGMAFSKALPWGQRIFQSKKYSALQVNHPITRYSLQELERLKISFHGYRNGPTWRRYTTELIKSLKNQGYDVIIGKFNSPAKSDLPVIEGWMQNHIVANAQRNGKNLLVTEAGFIGRSEKRWRSLGFNGLNGYATFAPAPASDNGARFQKYFGQYLQPWRQDKKGYALLIGQVPTDKDLYGLNLENWLQEIADRLNQKGIEVVFRPHPRVVAAVEKKQQELFIPKGTRLSHGTLDEDLAGAAYTVMYSSNTAVESVLAGVPAVVFSPGSVAWPVTSRDIDNPFYYPDRSQWCANLAWRQWTPEELADGTAWDHTKQVILKN